MNKSKSQLSQKMANIINSMKKMSPRDQQDAAPAVDVSQRQQEEQTERKIEMDVVLRILHRLPDPFNIMLFVLEVFRDRFGHYPDIMNPVTFNEKIQTRKVFDRRPILAMIADKFAVRDYVAERVSQEVLTKLYHVTTDPRDIPFARLPERYVLKATHGSGWVEIVKDHAKRDEGALIDTCRGWLAKNYYELSLEWMYQNIPRRIMVEEFLDNGSGEPAEDFKLFTFNGRVEFIQVDVGRFCEHKKNFYDRQWNLVPLRQEADNFPGVIPAPANLEALIECAEKLAAGLDFIRVDLYSLNNKIYFGELTVTPGNGFFRFEPPYFNEVFGKLWRMEIGSLKNLCGCGHDAK